MRILLTGSNGRLGHELYRALTPVGEVIAPSRADLDLTDARSIRAALESMHPDLIVNAAAHTDLESAEADDTVCRAVNEVAPEILATYCRDRGAALVHYSTDYVFNGQSSKPYRETDEPAPINAYGRAKLRGELAVEASGAAHLTIRCTWMYGDRGRNFVRSILQLSRERRELVVVDDQVGCPSWTRSIATVSARMLELIRKPGKPLSATLAQYSGIYHLCAAGQVNRYDFARRILAEDPGRAEQVCERLRRTSTEAYGEAAARPKYSVLDNGKVERVFGLTAEAWETQLGQMLSQLDHEPASTSFAMPNGAVRCPEELVD